MSDSKSQALQPLPRIEPFDFHGDGLIAVIVDGHEIALPIRSICGALGTPRYDGLPAKKYGAALDWLRARAAEYLPDDPEALPPLQESLL